MKILQFWTKYQSKIILYSILMIIVSLSVFNYTAKYHRLTDSAIDDTKTKLSAEIISQPVYEDGKYKFVALIMTSDNPDIIGLHANFYAEEKKGIKLYPGDSIRLSGEVERADVVTNDGGFNQRMYFMSENIHANVYSSSPFMVISNQKSGIEKSVGKLKNKFMDGCDKYFSPRYAGLIKALVSGETTFIEKTDSDVLKESGIYHIIAISGMHLNIFIIFVAFIVNRIKIKKMKKAIVLALGSIAISLFVLLFTEFGLSIVRAFVMLVISLGSGLFMRRYRPKTALFLSTVIILILIPRSYYNVGYQLSVLSTYAVLLSLDILKIMKRKNKLGSLYAAAWVGTILISALCFVTNMPVMIRSFGFISVYAWFANLLVLPVATPCLILGVLFAVAVILGFSPIAELISYPLKLSMQFMIEAAKVSVSMPHSVANIYPMYIPYLWMLMIFICVSAYLIYKRRSRLILTAAFILSLGISNLHSYHIHFPPDARIVFADVGQGDCSFIRLPGGEAFMIDFGSNYMTPYLSDEIETSLVKNNISKLDAVFITHFHTDHVSGIITLAKNELIEKIYIPKYYDKNDTNGMKNLQRLTDACSKSDTDICCLDEETEISMAGAEFNLIYPTKHANLNDNDMSAVIKFSYGETDILFTGDLSEEGCEAVLDKDIECDILKIPHHGAKNKLMGEIMNKTKAEFAIISCGRNNIYGHPHKDTMKSIRNRGAEILRTDTDGAVKIEFDKKGIKNIKTAL